jgi:hypothetical protein
MELCQPGAGKLKEITLGGMAESLPVAVSGRWRQGARFVFGDFADLPATAHNAARRIPDRKAHRPDRKPLGHGVHRGLVLTRGLACSLRGTPCREGRPAGLQLTSRMLCSLKSGACRATVR